MVIIQGTSQQQSASHTNSVSGHISHGKPRQGWATKQHQQDKHTTKLFWQTVTPDRGSPNLKKPQMIKQQQQKHHHRTEAKNRIQQHCFSSGLLLCLKGESLQWAIPALTVNSGSQTTHQFPIVHTWLEPRYFSGEEEQEQEIITTLKIPWRDELEGWVLGRGCFSCHSSHTRTRSGSRQAVWAVSTHPSPVLG